MVGLLASSLSGYQANIVRGSIISRVGYTEPTVAGPLQKRKS